MAHRKFRRKRACIYAGSHQCDPKRRKRAKRGKDTYTERETEAARFWIRQLVMNNAGEIQFSASPAAAATGQTRVSGWLWRIKGCIYCYTRRFRGRPFSFDLFLERKRARGFFLLLFFCVNTCARFRLPLLSRECTQLCASWGKRGELS